MTASYQSIVAGKHARPPRRWFRFSLRTLLILMLALGAFFGWFGNIAIRARRQQQEVAMIREMGGEVAYRDKDGVFWSGRSPRGPWLFRRIFGDAAFFPVEHVQFKTPVSDADLAKLAELERLQYVIVSGRHITDVGLAHLARLPALTGLNLGQATVTKEGLSKLALATHLQELSLYGPTIKDETLENIDSLRSLTSLQLARTVVTSAGMAPVGRLTKLQDLDILDGPGVGNEAMPHIAALTQLKRLQLVQTAVDDDGLSQLSQLSYLQKLTLRMCKVTDAGLAHLGDLKSLEELSLSSSGITDAGIAELGDLSSLRRLFLFGNITDACTDDLARLGGLGRLEVLDISGTAITWPAVYKLSRGIPAARIAWSPPGGGQILVLKDGRQVTWNR